MACGARCGAPCSAWEFISMFGAFLLLGVGVLLLGYWISKKTAKKEKAAQYNKPL